MATYAIGDIQGCFQQLEQLLAKIQFNQDCDQIWFTGDLINRGPQSLQTLRYIYSIRDNIKVVLGNHDLHLLATAYHHKHPSKKDTIKDILKAPDKLLLLDWLRQQPLIYHDTDINTTMLHAGIHPDWSLKKAISLSLEVESVLKEDDKHIHFYQHMYGDKPSQWTDDLTDWNRIRFITNSFTRLRYCDKNGKMFLNPKGVPGTQATGLYPWYEIQNRATKNEDIIFGHWSTLDFTSDVYNHHNVYPIDTGCLWGGKLTALRIDVKPFLRLTLDCPRSQNPSGFLA